MSFLSSLGQYVTSVADSVAGLALSPRRAPPARHRSAEESQAQQPQPSTATMRDKRRWCRRRRRQAATTVNDFFDMPRRRPTTSSSCRGDGRRRRRHAAAPVNDFFVMPRRRSTTSSTCRGDGQQLLRHATAKVDDGVDMPRRRSTTSSTLIRSVWFPRVVPTEGASALSARRRTLDCLAPAAPVRRGGSLRMPRHQPPPEKPAMAFCKRRLSWPEVDNSVNSGVQETDGSYFESFTALSWRQENRRLAALRLAEARAERPPPAPQELGLPSVSAHLSAKEHDHLYTEVLYCIENAVGAPAPDGQYAAYKEEVIEYARRAFRVPPDTHARAVHAAGSERPPTVVLGVAVLEADGLEAKDANGFSDPYCMLGIQPASLPASPRASEDEGRKHGFRLSFKRRDGRQQRDSLGRLPARYIRATSVRPHTLSPKWNETFKFDIDDISSDVLHLDIWDHDDESSVLDAVSRLNEVRGVRGLGRFFKQVCQSARQGSQDDFLGCVNIPLREIPSTGVEAWYKLEARSQRSSVQGRIRLRLWLSAREAGRHDDDNYQQVRQHERLFGVLLAHELETAASQAAAAAAAGAEAENTSAAWEGELCGAAQTLLHQHAVQGDLSSLQAAIARFAAACRLNSDAPVDPKYMFKLLTELEKAWCACEAMSGGGSGDSSGTASRDEERWLADCFCEFVDRALHQLRLHRDLYPVLHHLSLNKLEFLLRCLSQLAQMKAFWRCCPFNKEIRSEIVGALRKGTAEWYEALCAQDTESERGEDLVNLITLVQIDLQQGLTYYHPLFETTNNVPYFHVVFMQIDKMVSEDVRQCVDHWVNEGWCGVAEEEIYDEQGNGVCVVSAKTLPFEVLAAVRELCAAAAPAPSNPHEPPAHLFSAYMWFEPLIDRWLAVTKTMALQRVRAAVELDRSVEGEHLVKHSTSSVDTAACLYHMRLVWRAIGGAEEGTVGGGLRLLEAACATALHYADLVHGALADQGYYENHGQNKTTEEICTIVNNLEYVRRSLAEYDDEHIETYRLMMTIQEHVSVRSGNDDNARQLVRGALGTLDARAARAANPLAARARPPLRKAVFHLAWSPDTLPCPQAITPLLEFLDHHLSQLNTWLLPRAFTRALAGCWSAVLKEVSTQADAGGAERPRVYHHRLREALDLLAEFFHAEGKGLPMSEVHNAEWARLEQRMQYHQAPTEELLELWLADRLADQIRTPLPSAYGSILVRVYFNHDSLCVEVLSARDVIPLDPNGLSDPFVVLELLPKRLFPKAHEQQTNVQKKTLNPVWDECFEFAVSLESCRSPQAALALSVWDRDVLTADDFAGEAFVALSRIPGVNSHAPPDPLRPLELPLMQLHDRNHPILQILESRTTDKLAVDFVKKQKLRFAEQ
ncbi:BAI1-associated protein 3 [Pectinophora gossypiella]|uniref:BAI1-associated protein 3 n=1 Tax=Pectinophora gossypiella TaxID=13191 RepID=UPI00214EC69C|nr:BAI1-associated protein 3 [Pectinophora gossypiella]